MKKTRRLCCLENKDVFQGEGVMNLKKNADRSNKKGFKLMFEFSNMEDIGKLDKIHSSEGTRVNLRGRGNDRETRQFLKDFCKIDK